YLQFLLADNWGCWVASRAITERSLLVMMAVCLSKLSSGLRLSGPDDGCIDHDHGGNCITLHRIATQCQQRSCSGHCKKRTEGQCGDDVNNHLITMKQA